MPCSKSHIKGAVFKNEMAEMRNGRGITAIVQERVTHFLDAATSEV